jgi:hypothetical protein
MHRSAALALLVLSGTVPLSAQDSTAAADTSARKVTPRDSANVLVLEHDYTGPGEFARVFLESGQVYRAELSDADASLEIYPVKGGPPVFLAREESEGPDAGGHAVFSVYPRADAMYQIRLISGGPVVTLRLFRDIRASRRRQKILREPGWEIGGEIALGMHGGYFLNTAGGGLKDSDRAGFHVEGCFSARQGPGILRVFSACAFGLAWDSRPGTRGVLWFYLEPRLRLIGGRPRGQSNSEAGVLLRTGFGFISKANRNPTLVAPGLYLARNIRLNQGGKGWSFMLAWRHGLVGNRGEGVSRTTTEMATFSIGYYQ